MWYLAHLASEGSLMLMELLVLMEEQRKPKPDQSFPSEDVIA